MIGALALDGFRGFTTIDMATNAEVFALWVEQELVPNLKPGDVVVMDNLSAHKTVPALDLIHNAGAEVLFLPPYSPEFNPIEKAWSKLKQAVRRLPSLTREAFERAIAKAMDSVTEKDVRAWTSFCGYSVNLI